MSQIGTFEKELEVVRNFPQETPAMEPAENEPISVPAPEEEPVLVPQK